MCSLINSQVFLHYMSRVSSLCVKCSFIIHHIIFYSSHVLHHLSHVFHICYIMCHLKCHITSPSISHHLQCHIVYHSSQVLHYVSYLPHIRYITHHLIYYYVSSLMSYHITFNITSYTIHHRSCVMCPILLTYVTLQMCHLFPHHPIVLEHFTADEGTGSTLSP